MTLRVLNYPPTHAYHKMVSEPRLVTPLDLNYGDGTVHWRPIPEEYYHPIGLDKLKPDILNFHFSWDEDLWGVHRALRWAKRNRVPTIWTCHEMTGLYVNGGRARLSTRIARNLVANVSTLIITLTEGCKKEIVARYKIDPHKIHTCPHPPMRDWKKTWPYMTKAAARQAIGHKYGLAEGDFVYTVFGDPRPNRDHFAAISAFKAMKRHCPRAKLLLTFPAIDYCSDSAGTVRSDVVTMERVATYDRDVVWCPMPGISDHQLEEIFFMTDVAVLPYRWGAHSGQIELAKDFGCGMIVPSCGHYAEQMGGGVFGRVYNNTDGLPWHTSERIAKAMLDCYEVPFPTIPADERLRTLELARSITYVVYDMARLMVKK